MICTYCNTQNDANALFCGQCGKLLRETSQTTVVHSSYSTLDMSAPTVPNTIPVASAQTAQLVCTYRGHNDPVCIVVWSPDGKYIASGSFDKTMQVWEALNGRRVLSIRAYSPGSIAWSPDGSYIASCMSGGVKVREALSGKEVLTHYGEGHVLGYIVAWSPNGKYFASECDSRVGVRVCEALNGKEVLIRYGHVKEVTTIAWSPDGKYIASGAFDKTVQVWEALTGAEVFTYRDHSDTVCTVVWSPDGKHIASSSRDNIAQVWEALNGRRVLSIRAYSPGSFGNSIAWSPNGKYIAISSYESDGVGVCEALNGKEVLTYRAHDHILTTIAWSPDGKYIASGAYDDKTVQVWKVALI